MDQIGFEERVAFRISKTQARKLDALRRATRRTRSDIVRLLIDAAVSDGRPDLWLDSDRLEGVERGK